MAGKTKLVTTLVVAYLLLLLLHAPARLLQYLLPPSLNIGAFSGSLWRGSLHQLHWKTLNVAEVRWQLTLTSAFCPAFRLVFDDPQGIQGQGTLCGWQQWQLLNWQLSAPAAVVWQQVAPESVPITSQGRIALALPAGSVDRQGCRQLRDGLITWQQGTLTTPLGELLLASPRVAFRCEQRNIAMTLQQHSPHLQITGRGRLNADGHYQLNGQLIAGEQLPATFTPLLATLGKPGVNGAIDWHVDGQLK